MLGLGCSVRGVARSSDVGVNMFLVGCSVGVLHGFETHSSGCMGKFGGKREHARCSQRNRCDALLLGEITGIAMRFVSDVLLEHVDERIIVVWGETQCPHRARSHQRPHYGHFGSCLSVSKERGFAL